MGKQVIPESPEQDALPVAMLSDARVLELCAMQMLSAQQDELSDLLSGNRENQLTEVERVRLDELMGIYRSGMLRKAEAFRVAAQRGLRTAHD